MRALPEGFCLAVIIAAKSQRLAGAYVEFGRVELRRNLECILPNKHYFVDGAKSIDLKLVVTIASVDKELDVILIEDERVALGESGFDEGLFDPESHV